LGLPLPTGRLKGDHFQSLEERYVKRMVGWNERCLSQVAKEIPIKSVAQALPTYVMSVFKIPFELCDSLQKHIQSFWWGSDQGKHKVQWIPWEVLVKPKNYDRLGFKDLRLFNQALLASGNEADPISNESVCIGFKGEVLSTKQLAGHGSSERGIRYMEGE
jgi:hypothetical protein